MTRIIPLEATGIGIFHGPPSLLIDGYIPAEYTWRQDYTVWSYNADPIPQYTINLGGYFLVEDLTVSVDNNDEYIVRYSSDNLTYFDLFKISPYDGNVTFGLDTITTIAGVPEYIPASDFTPIEARFLRIYSTGVGDNSYGVAEVMPFGREVAVYGESATFTVSDNSPLSTFVGTVTARGEDPLTYTITGGNSNPDGDSNFALAMNNATGAITVNDSGDLDYETTPTFNLTVKATDAGSLSDTAAIKINLSDINELPGGILFQDNFDSGTLSSEWETVWPSQFVENGWLHSKDTDGWPRDSQALVHDGDTSWTNYTVSLTADFVTGSPWLQLTVLFRTNNYSRSSAGTTGDTYAFGVFPTGAWGGNWRCCRSHTS